MFEMYTYESLLDDAIEQAPTDIDTRKGSIFYDAISGVLMKIAKLYTDLDSVFDMIFIDSATGEYLDKRAQENGLTRLSATRCCYNACFEGVVPMIGERFFAEGIYFGLDRVDSGTLYFVSEVAGEKANNIYADTPAIPINNIKGLDVARFGEVVDFGTEEESDDALRSRVREKIGSSSENGTAQNYKTWCEAIDGVGRARIFPLWAGICTVKGVVVDTQGLPATHSVVNRVQEYIDPDSLGLGEGAANLGAHFTAVSATQKTIDLSFSAVLLSAATLEQVKTETQEAVKEYFKEQVLNTPESESVVIRISKVGAVINGLPSILDYSDLTFNSSTANVEILDEEVAVLGEVTINV